LAANAAAIRNDNIRLAMSHNTLYYGDNLLILRQHIPDAAVDLIYLDPPFNSNRSYNVLFKDESGTEAESQIQNHKSQI